MKKRRKLKESFFVLLKAYECIKMAVAWLVNAIKKITFTCIKGIKILINYLIKVINWFHNTCKSILVKQG